VDEFAIRPARTEDAATLADAWIELGRDYAELDPVQFCIPRGEDLVGWVRGSLSEPRGDDEAWLVAERDGHVVGYVRAEITRPTDEADRQLVRDVGEPVLKVQALVVLAPERRRGAGTSLMQAVEDWARSRGAARSFLMTYLHSPSAVPFYEQQMGYQRKMLGFWKEL
jgi:GNAT superfamily N-acetyltransferase